MTKQEFINNELIIINKKIDTFETILSKQSNWTTQFKVEINRLCNNLKIIRVYLENKIEKN